MNGAALVAARCRKERTYPELARPGTVLGSWFWPARLAVGGLKPERSFREEIPLMQGGTSMATPVGLCARMCLC